MRKLLLLAVIAAAACSAAPVRNPIAGSSTPLSIAPDERWDPVSVCGKMIQRWEDTAGTGTGPPIEMVVLGDSIVWGQGLVEDEKASTLVQHRLAEKHGRPVRKRVYAHSGATVAADGFQGNLLPPEVPSSFPHIDLQAECVPNPERVDLVLVNGCINDMDATVLFDPTTDADEIGLENLCESKCKEPMRLLLSRIARRFPNARIVVAGYYPFFSERTPRMTFHFVTRLFLLMAKTGGEPHSVPDAADHMIRKSAVWHEVSNRTLREAAQASGGDEGVPGRVVFAPVPFRPEHAYGAPESLLWAVTEHDNVASSRWWNCTARPKLPERLRCINASAFHPNPNGAIVYAEAILRALEIPPDRPARLPNPAAPGN